MENRIARPPVEPDDRRGSLDAVARRNEPRSYRDRRSPVFRLREHQIWSVDASAGNRYAVLSIGGQMEPDVVIVRPGCRQHVGHYPVFAAHEDDSTLVYGVVFAATTDA